MTRAEILTEILAVYAGSSGDATKALYARLDAIGPAGQVATNLFRASKSSGRAKVYRRGPGHRTAAYERKAWSLANLADLLTQHGEALSIPAAHGWGWKEDPAENHAKWVLYVELPDLGALGGQVSFHSPWRGLGPAYTFEWDRLIGRSTARVCQYCANVLTRTPGIDETVPAIAEAMAKAAQPTLSEFEAGLQRELEQPAADLFNGDRA